MVNLHNKACPRCGNIAQPDAFVCPKCQQHFAMLHHSSRAAAVPIPPQSIPGIANAVDQQYQTVRSTYMQNSSTSKQSRVFAKADNRLEWIAAWCSIWFSLIIGVLAFTFFVNDLVKTAIPTVGALIVFLVFIAGVAAVPLMSILGLRMLSRTAHTDSIIVVTRPWYLVPIGICIVLFILVLFNL